VAVLFAGMLAACAAPAGSVPPTPADGSLPDSLSAWLAAARTGVQSALDAGVESLRRHDFDGSLELLAPDFKLVWADGTPLMHDAYVAARRERFAHVVDLDATTHVTVGRVIDWTPARPWEAQEPEIVVATHQHASGTERGEDGRVGPFTSNHNCHETWRHSAAGWRRVRVDQDVE
jgi:hypothetical protein